MDHILFAYQFHNSHHITPLNERHISDEIKDRGLAWVHLDLNNAQTEPWLRKEIAYLDPFIINALVADETRPRITEIGDGLLIILRGVNLNKDADPEDMVSVRLWIDAHRIITVQKRPLKAIFDIKQRIDTQDRCPKDAGDFLAMLIHRILERMSPILSDLDERLDIIEEEIIDNPNITIRERIANIRRQALSFRRYIAPQRDALGVLKLTDVTFWKPHHKRGIQESYDRNTKYVEDLDEIRERGTIVKDELANSLSDRINKNMYILSVISAIFLPLGFLTGMFGINIGGMPGTDNDYAFAIFTAMLICVTGFQVVIFKKLKWF